MADYIPVVETDLPAFSKDWADKYPFPMLFDLIEGGETVTLCREGEPVAVVVGVERYRDLIGAVSLRDVDDNKEEHGG